MKNRDFFIVEDLPIEFPIEKAKDEAEKIKSITLFDHLKYITEHKYDKEYFDNLSESDRKTFSTYMINRYLSMNPDWLSIVSMIQKISYDVSPEALYKIYGNIIPKGRTFLKYVKGKKEKRFNNELLELIAHHYQISKRDATDYLMIFFSADVLKESLIKICKMYAKTEEEIKNLLKTRS